MIGDQVLSLAQLTDYLMGQLGPGAVQIGEPLSQHTTLRIGGPADILALVDNIKQLRMVVTSSWANGLPCRVLGGGSNILVSDEGIRGVVVLNRARRTTIFQSKVKAESGATFSRVAQQCVTRGLAGLEWATGIPGTVGGAVVGNAGAWGSDVASTLLQATVLEPPGTVVEWPVERLKYGYRASALKRQAGDISPRAVVVEAQFALRETERHALEAQVAHIVAQRRAKQPSGATCGSIFKNPPGEYAGRLIEAAGLKGQSHGDAEISTVHANFVVNRGNATASDVKALIDLARQTVKTRLGVTLELEIELLGEW